MGFETPCLSREQLPGTAGSRDRLGTPGTVLPRSPGRLTEGRASFQAAPCTGAHLGAGSSAEGLCWEGEVLGSDLGTGPRAAPASPLGPLHQKSSVQPGLRLCRELTASLTRCLSSWI